jgi:hypothetical protein
MNFRKLIYGGLLIKNRQKGWLWLSTAVLFVVGFILVMNDSGAGWFLIILGITYLGLSTGRGQTWAVSNPKTTRWVFVGMTVLLVMLAIIIGVGLLLK